VIEPVRPRAVTVIAVIWLYVGPSWLLLGGAMMLAMLIFATLSAGFAWMDVLPWYFSAVAVLGASGTVAAYKLLCLRRSGRLWLELVSWASFCLIQAFAFRVGLGLATTTTWLGARVVSDPGRLLLALSMGLLAGLPFLVMAGKLRSQIVRGAIRDAEIRTDR
jgi:hypothetical protein